MLTEELCFSIFPVKNRLHVRMKKRNRLHQKFVVPTFKSGYQTVSAWSIFSFSRYSPLTGIIGTFTQHKYRAIIDAHTLQFTNYKQRDSNAFTLQEDSCGPY